MNKTEYNCKTGETIQTKYEPSEAETLFYQCQQQESRIMMLRCRRNTECFSVVDRGQLWYDKLTAEQLVDLETWYSAWLDVTETLEIPEKPDFI